MINNIKKSSTLLTFCLLIFLLISIYFICNISIPTYDKKDIVKIKTNILGSKKSLIKNNNDFDIRLIESPIIFALPTKIGFSKDLFENENKVDLFFAKSPEKEAFFKFENNISDASKNSLLFEEIEKFKSANIPNIYYENVEKKNNLIQYKLSKNLEQIIENKLIFSLDDEDLKINDWFAKATLHISKDGFVRHVFIDDISEKSINKITLINMLYNIKFKSGFNEIGWIVLSTTN